MNKGAIQRFAIWARNELIAQVSQRAYQYGIDESGFGDASADTLGGRLLTAEEKSQRQELIKQIKEKGYKQVMEEVAYTWFNRFIALRFMEVNGFLPSHIRVFSDASGTFKPEILNDVLHLDLPGLDSGKVAEYIESNDTEALYRYLLLTQCNALNSALPVMFERMGGYTEMLLPNNILRQDSVLGHMVSDIPEEDWQDAIQIIGWLYQYYNTELKDDTFAQLKKNVKITKERIPAATQLFTPDWIVRYMVENSLGRLWLEGHPNAELHDGWKYYLDEAEQEPEVETQLAGLREEYKAIKPEEIKVIDPCMGSGHILVYAFDVLMQIYTSAGWDQREAAQSILKNNLYGLDIDDRAAQLAYFAVMMKARQYDRRLLTRGIQPNIYSIRESNGIQAMTIEYFHKNDPKLKADIESIVTEMRDAKEYGSILSITPVDFAALYARLDEIKEDISLFATAAQSELRPLIEVAEILSKKYHVVVTNPPYMGANGMGAKLSDFVKKNYPDTKSDMSTVCMEKTIAMCTDSGYMAMINIPVWMFLTSYEALRNNLFRDNSFINMLHLGRGVFGSDFGTTSFVISKKHIADYSAMFLRLYFKQGAVDSVDEKEKYFFERNNVFYNCQENFCSVPGSPVAYWLGNSTLIDFRDNDKVSPRFGTAKKGLSTGDNDRFLRLWTEVPFYECGIGLDKYKLPYRWIPLNKGGSFRKWYGNNEYVINWYDNGAEIKSFKGSVIRNPDYYFRKSITWTMLSASCFGVRLSEQGKIFEGAGPSLFANSDMEYYLLAVLCSKVGDYFIRILNPTININIGDVCNIPIIIDKKDLIESKAKELVKISKSDWDSFETPWDFRCHPLVTVRDSLAFGQFAEARHKKVASQLSECFREWESLSSYRFYRLKENEEELNRIFIDIYDLQGELTPEVDEQDVTVRKADLGRDIRSLISYAVGCMFGRYSLDCEGLAYAGGEWDASKYTTFPADKDNIIPICDDDYFDDDITGRFIKWIETVYGAASLESNLKFIADALGGKGTPREVIRSYFLNDFYADHLKTYQKRPIYWLFDSGKKNGFKALCYMHRYQRDLLARLRTDYVHEQQERYRTQLAQLGDAIDHASASERVKLTKQQKKIQEQALEIQKYEEKVHHLADQNIQIDLDDGVKHNYELFADVLAKIN